MSKPFKLILAAVVLLAAVGGGTWYFLLRSDAPEEAALREREPSTTAAPDATPTSLPTTAGGTGDDVLSGPDADDARSEVDVVERVASGGDESPDGQWVLVPDDGTHVFAGYRMQELFGGDTLKVTAVGRTPALAGTMTVQDTTVLGASVTADLTQLASDKGRRDNFLLTNALEIDDFPEAVFELDGPLELGSVPSSGETMDVTVPGKLTLHGVTHDVEVPVTARWSGPFIDLSGNIEILLDDYGIERPDIAGMVSVERRGIMEFQLSFERS